MAYVVLVIEVPSKSIEQLNADCVRASNNMDSGINACADLLSGIAAKLPGAAVQVTTRSTDPSVTTAGTNSQQVTYNNK